MQIALAPSTAPCRSRPAIARRAGRVVVRAQGEDRVLREYREADDTITDIPAEGASEAPVAPTAGSEFADELPPVPRTEMSAEMKAKLKEEYYGLGGSPNRAMSSNFFLNIILVVSFLAVLCYALGYLG